MLTLRHISLWPHLTHNLVEMPTLFVFPYFLADAVAEALPSLAMLDYRVQYDNHRCAPVLPLVLV